MPTAPRTQTRPENLSLRAEAVRARTAEVLASSRDICQGAAQTRRQSAELREASREVRLRCRLVTETSAARRRPSISRYPEHLQIAHAIACALAELGVPAFVFE